MRAPGVAMLLVTFVAHARPPSVSLLPRLSAQTVEQEAPAPALRPAAIGAFAAAGLALGAAAYFGVQSNGYRSEYLAAASFHPVKTSWSTMNQWYQPSVQNGEIAVSLLGGAAAFAAVGALLWWYGTPRLPLRSGEQTVLRLDLLP